MKLIVPPVQIDETDDYTTKCVIDRSEFGKFLTNLVRETTEPLVIAIDGRWGEGKTTFVKIWQNQLECKGKWEPEKATERVPTLYIDAFKMEATDDVFISLVAEINAFVSENCGDAEKLRLLREAAIKVGVKLIPKVANAALRTVTLNVLDSSLLDGVKFDRDALARNLSAQAEKLLEDRLRSLVDQKEIMDDFRRKLTELPASIENNPSNQMVIIIDELDRCSPKYAVEFLEKIKHFFLTENVKFVLVVNRNQLEESIRATYGPGTDAFEYLQKFVDVEASLPKNNRDLSKSDATGFCNSLFERHEVVNDQLSHSFNEFVKKFAFYSNLSFRQMEKVYSRFMLVKFLNERNFSRWDDAWFGVVSYVVLAKAIDADHFQKLINGTVTGKMVHQFFDSWLRGARCDSDFLSKIRLIECICMNEEEFEILGECREKGIINIMSNESNVNIRTQLDTICRVLSSFDMR
jgi:hypothetical protein